MTDEPTHRDQPAHIRGMLAEELQTLKLLEEELKRRPDQDLHERSRVDAVSVAIGYLQQAMDALKMMAHD